LTLVVPAGNITVPHARYFMIRRNISAQVVALAVALLLVPSIARAYLDPGNGSYVLQILIGGFIAAAFAAKVFWLNIAAFFGRKRSDGKQPPR
jgi:hypothetical protein